MVLLAGCSSESVTQPETASYSAPKTYAAATVAAVTPGLVEPVGPWSCQSIGVKAPAGTVMSFHGLNGNITQLTANASGVVIRTGGRLMSPKSTLWMTVDVPAGFVAEWSGVQYESVDSSGATWTAPKTCSDEDPAIVFVLQFIPVPFGNG